MGSLTHLGRSKEKRLRISPWVHHYIQTKSHDLNIIKGSENQHKLKEAEPSINNDLEAQPKKATSLNKI